MDPLLFRRKMIGLGGAKVPYQRIEYLESNGAQYIDTGYYPKENTRIITRIACSADKQSNAIFAVDSGQYTGTDAYSLFFYRSNVIASVFGSEYQSITIQTQEITEAEVSKDVFRFGNQSISRNGTPVTSRYPMTLFAWSRSGDIIVYGYVKIASFAVYEGDSLVMNFVPVRIGQVGCLYDTVSRQLFGNAGTGDFALGPDI